MDSQALQYRERFKDQVITFTPYAFKKMGLVQSQTLLKIDVYSLICVPYRMSFSSVALLVSFSQEEVVFFQRFKGGLASLTIVFQSAANAPPLKLFTRCSLSSIAPVKNRSNIALVNLDFKPCPDDLANVMGDYLSALEQMKVEYDQHDGRPIKLNPDTARNLGFNDYAVFLSPSGDRRVSLFALTTDSIQLLFPPNSPDIPPGSDGSAKLYFRSYQFTASGMVTEALRMPTGVLKTTLKVDFSPELSEILSSYYVSDKFRQTISGKR
jgi:hypothetical protein